MNIPTIRKIITAAHNEGRGKLYSDEAKSILQAAGINMPKFHLVNTITEAVEAANSIGYPVAMKVVSDDIIHKSDVGGVILDIDDKNEAADAYEAIIQSCKRHVPKAIIRGIEVVKIFVKRLPDETALFHPVAVRED